MSQAHLKGSEPEVYISCGVERTHQLVACTTLLVNEDLIAIIDAVTSHHYQHTAPSGRLDHTVPAKPSQGVIAAV